MDALFFGRPAKLPETPGGKGRPIILLFSSCFEIVIKTKIAKREVYVKDRRKEEGEVVKVLYIYSGRGVT